MDYPLDLNVVVADRASAAANAQGLAKIELLFESVLSDGSYLTASYFLLQNVTTKLWKFTDSNDSFFTQGVEWGRVGGGVVVEHKALEGGGGGGDFVRKHT